jgi:hypothetical protein
MFKIELYVPVENAESVKSAMFAAGGGAIGNYDRCCWETLGTGQFRPLNNADPFIGETGKVEFVQELKIEMVCDDDRIEDVVAALLEAHPYETPAFQFWRVRTS